jgi:small subunit ribosomal protein S7
MPRRKLVKPRQINPDPVYKNRLVAKLINRSMKAGKKSVAQKQVYKALGIIKEKTKSDPIKVFSNALSNIKPSMEVRPRRVGGAAYQVPMSVRGTRRETLAIRWLIQAARKRSNSEYKTYAKKLAAEIIDASKGEGGAVKKRTDTERMAEANRAFAHFRW